MDKFEKRRQRLQLLIDRECGGKIAECARRISRNQNYVGRLLYPVGKPGKKNIADGMIEVIEEAFGLPRGWLDGYEESAEVAAISKIWPTLSKYKRLAIISLIEAIAKAEEPDDNAPGAPIPPPAQPQGKKNNPLWLASSTPENNPHRRSGSDRRAAERRQGG